MSTILELLPEPLNSWDGYAVRVLKIVGEAEAALGIFAIAKKA
jgi:hypothetical protein